MTHVFAFVYSAFLVFPLKETSAVSQRTKFASISSLRKKVGIGPSARIQPFFAFRRRLEVSSAAVSVRYPLLLAPQSLSSPFLRSASNQQQAENVTANSHHTPHRLSTSQPQRFRHRHRLTDRPIFLSTPLTAPTTAFPIDCTATALLITHGNNQRLVQRKTFEKQQQQRTQSLRPSTITPQLPTVPLHSRPPPLAIGASYTITDAFR